VDKKPSPEKIIHRVGACAMQSKITRIVNTEIFEREPIHRYCSFIIIYTQEIVHHQCVEVGFHNQNSTKTSKQSKFDPTSLHLPLRKGIHINGIIVNIQVMSIAISGCK
jgi:hypothetical protein